MKRILLDAYFDNNFGDDLFVDILLNRYSDAMFYSFWKETPESVLSRAAQFKNLVILPGGCIMQESWSFDGFVMIGGDVLPDGVNYKERIDRMKHVKSVGGFVAMLGFSLYATYGEKTAKDLQIMAELADVIVIRDMASANRFCELVPQARVIESADMVFAGLQKQNYAEEVVLGVIPRRKLYSTDEEHQTYCKGMAAIADRYLQEHEKEKVRFLAFSTGEYDDRKTAEDIRALMKEKEKTELVAYEGEIGEFLQAIGTCKALLATRFHGLVFALLQRIPFVPVIYEVKLEQLLDELEYSGIRLEYGAEFTEEQIVRASEALGNWQVPAGTLEAYEEKATGFFEKMDVWYENADEREKATLLTQKTCSVREEHAKLVRENKMLLEQQKELEKWVAALQEQRDAFEKQNMHLEEIRKQQKQELQSTHQALQQTQKDLQQEIQKYETETEILKELQLQQTSRIAVLENEKHVQDEQVEELEKWIKALKKERESFEKQGEKFEKLCQEKLQQMGRLAVLENEKYLLQDQVSELEKWVAVLKKERKSFEKQNQELEEIRKWQRDKMTKLWGISEELETEYNSYVQALREKLDKQFGL